MSNNHYMIGRRVIIHWTNEAYRDGKDWVAFRILDVSDDGYWCMGVTDPSGAPHDGSKVFIKFSEFLDITTWKEDAQ